MKILVTGTAGFIGFHLVKKLLDDENVEIAGLDNLNDYYDVNLKMDRLKETGITQIPDNEFVQSNLSKKYKFIKADLNDQKMIAEIFEHEKFDVVVNLAAQAGVRYSLENPQSYVDSNISGFLNVLEGCRHNLVKHLIYASSSSVYGSNTQMPFSVNDRVDNPVSLYAASKKSNELMAHTYSHLFGVPTTGLRFFTVYGPWGRPDMALFLFTKAILKGEPIDVFNYGEMARDFTYIDDIVQGIHALIHKSPFPTKNGSDSEETEHQVPYNLYNIGRGSPVELMEFITEIEHNLGLKADKKMLPIQPGDVPKTWADAESLFQVTGFRPQIPIKEGVEKFIDWYRKYYRIANENSY